MRKQVLVVEDEPSIQHVLEVTLKCAGYDVLGAYDGRNALEQLQTAVPDVILLDLMMPGMNGFEFIKELDRQGKRLAIPIIVLSASMLGQDLTPMYVSAYLSKPFSMKTLLDKVRQCVRSPLPQA